MSRVSPDIKSVFGRAVEIESPAERAAYLDEACGQDAALRGHVDELLAAADKAGSFMWRPAAAAGQTELFEKISEGPGTVVGPYKLLQQIGEGGMGIVFMAQQSRPVQRIVALKIIKPGMDTRQVIARFEAERQALALMDHPNIAKVLDAGTTEGGRPYFVMELVKGMPITKYCDQHHLTPRERLELFIPVCHAVQHAHQKGIIHRDLKPSNVMVAQYDGQPVPKIIDFGVVKATGPKLTDRTMFTEFGAIIGTLEYMSPEQAEMNQLDVDTRSDIYALGVLLYELLTGTTPLDRSRLKESALHEVLRVIREEEPPIPSTRINTNFDLPSVAANRGMEPARLSGLVRGELDWIVMKALEKDRNRRYETANGLLRDVERYLADEPVQACPPSATYRFRKYARRHKVALVTSAIVAASLLLATTVSIWQATLARRAEVLAQTRLAAEQEALQRAIAAEQLAQNRLESERQAQSRASAETAKAGAITNLLQTTLQSASKDQGKGSGINVRNVLDEVTESLGDQLHDQPETEAKLRATAGDTYRQLGELDKAEPNLQTALTLRKQIFGPDHADIASSLYDYAFLLFERDRFADAEERVRDAIAMQRKLGLRNESIIQSLSLLQLCLIYQSKYEQADAAADEALSIASEQSGHDGEVANILHRRADALIQQGLYAEAESLARRSAALHQKWHGDNHPETGWGLLTLSRSLQAQQKYDEAEKSSREALSIFRRLYADTHKCVQSALQDLSAILTEKGDEAGLTALRAELAAADRLAQGYQSDFGVATATIPIEMARGKRVTFSGWIKTENVDEWAGLWWRIDGPNGETLKLDNMHDRGPHGSTDWARFSIDLDVPDEATQVIYGVLMSGKGRAWFDGLEVKLDGEDYRDDRYDFNFESPEIMGMFVVPRSKYRTELDDHVAQAGTQSLRIESTTQPVKVDPIVYADYAGRYELEFAGALITVSQDRDRLMVQLTGQPAYQVHPDPDSKTRFSYRVVDAQITFERDESGKVDRLILNQNGQDLIARKLEPGTEPVAVEIDPKLLDEYVGTYRHSAGLEFTVTKDKVQLWVQLSGQPKIEVYPKSPTRFFYKVVMAEIEFRKDDAGQVDGLTLFQGGIEIFAAKDKGPMGNTANDEGAKDTAAID